MGTLLDETAEAAGTEETSEIDEEIKKADEAVKRLRAPRGPLDVDTQTLEQAQQELKTLDARLSVLAERQTDRVALLSGGFADQRTELRQKRDTLAQEYEQARLTTTTMPMTASGDAHFADTRRERLQVEIAATEIRLRNVDLREQLTERTHHAHQRLLTVVRDQRDVLKQHVELLSASHGPQRDRTTRRCLWICSEPCGPCQGGPAGSS